MRSHGRIIAAGAATIVFAGTAAACGGGNSGLDEEAEQRACEVGEALIGAVTAGDEEATDQALDDLFRIDGADDGFDLDAIEDAAGDLDEEAAETLAGELDEVGCGLDPDDIEIAAPPDTEPEDTEPDLPETTTDTAPTTADTTGTTGPDDPEGGPLDNLAVDVGAGSVPDGVEHGETVSPQDIIAEYGLQGVIYPDTDEAQLMDVYIDVRSGLETRTDELTFAIVSDTEMDGVLKAFRTGAGELGDYEFTDRSEPRDGVESVSSKPNPPTSVSRCR